MTENVFEAVKQSVSTRDAAAFYGIEVKRNGMACCPFHDDKEARVMFEKFHRGDIYSADLSPGIGSEQSGSRPVLILQNNVGNCFSPTIIIAAITSVSKKSRKFPTHYHLNDRCGLVKPSVVMLEQIRTIDKSRLKNYIGHLNKDDMENINKTLLCSLGIT